MSEIAGLNLNALRPPNRHEPFDARLLKEGHFAYLMHDGEGKPVGVYFLKGDASAFQSILDYTWKSIVCVYAYTEESPDCHAILADLVRQAGMKTERKDGKDMDGIQDTVYILIKV